MPIEGAELLYVAVGGGIATGAQVTLDAFRNRRRQRSVLEMLADEAVRLKTRAGRLQEIARQDKAGDPGSHAGLTFVPLRARLLELARIEWPEALRQDQMLRADMMELDALSDRIDALLADRLHAVPAMDVRGGMVNHRTAVVRQLDGVIEVACGSVLKIIDRFEQSARAHSRH